VLCFDTPVWAARLRFQVPELLEQLRFERDFNRIASVRFAVASAAEPSSQAPRDRPGVSAATARYLRGLADCTRDPDLKSIFEKLSRRTHAERQNE
jgi:hypothetical protein